MSKIASQTLVKYYDIIKGPVITEKSLKLVETFNKYTFKVSKKANKIEIKNAIEELFNVKVLNVNTITVLPKHKRVGKYEGLTQGYKKAIVSLEKGDKITQFTV